MRAPTVSLLLCLAAAPLRAQDSTTADPRRADMLRGQIEERFSARLRQDLALTPDQEARMRTSLRAVALRRRGLENDGMALRQALMGQLRPGIAASPDSVTKLLDGIAAQRIAFAQLLRDEMKEMAGILTPIQRGQYFLLREQVAQRAADLMQERKAVRQGEGGPNPRRPRPFRP